MSSNRVPALVSLAVHAAVVGALVWVSSARESEPARDPGFFGTAPRESSSGLATRRPAPPIGPSIPPDRAIEYLGRYRIVSPGQPDTELLVTVVNDGGIEEDHWSLVLQEGEFAPYKLVPFAADSFAHQLDREQRIVFWRSDSAVTAIELSGRGRMRRGVKVLAAERE
jgi:hypothetical protein